MMSGCPISSRASPVQHAAKGGWCPTEFRLGKRGSARGDGDLMPDQGWQRRFDQPIPLPRRQLVALKDAGTYITTLPEAEHEAAEWQAAMEALIWSLRWAGRADRRHAGTEPAR
jgi:hypothetical protein